MQHVHSLAIRWSVTQSNVCAALLSPSVLSTFLQTADMLCDGDGGRGLNNPQRTTVASQALTLIAEVVAAVARSAALSQVCDI